MHHCRSKDKNCVQLARVPGPPQYLLLAFPSSNCVISANSVLSPVIHNSTNIHLRPRASLQSLNSRALKVAPLQSLFWAFLPVRRFTQKVEVSWSFHILRLTVNGGIFIESFYLFPKTKGMGVKGRRWETKATLLIIRIQAKIKQLKSHFSVYKSLCLHPCTLFYVCFEWCKSFKVLSAPILFIFQRFV